MNSLGYLQLTPAAVGTDRGHSWPCGRAVWAWTVLAAMCPSTGDAADVTRENALTTAVERADVIADRFIRTWARYAIAEEWDHTDPAKAAELADRLESWTAKQDLLGIVMVTWGQQDPEAAGAWGVQFQQRTAGTLAQRNTALHHAVVGMVTRAPKLAEQLTWEYLHEEGWGGHPRTTPLAAARVLAKSDPAAALALAEKIQLESYRVDALRAVLQEWARQDPKAARAALSGRPEEKFQEAFARDLAEGWAHRDPLAAAEFAKTIPDARTRMMALALVAREMSRTDPKAAAAICTVVASLNKGRWHEQMRRVETAVSEVAEAFARHDPLLAVQWATSLPPGDGGCLRPAIDGVAAGWAATDVRAALEFYSVEDQDGHTGGNKGTGAAYPALAGQLAKTDVETALTLVRRTDRLVLQSHIIHNVAMELTARNPEEAARLVEQWEGVTDYYGYRSDAASSVAETWARSSPEQAAAWAEKLQPAADRTAALRAVAAVWARGSRDRAHAWAQSLKDPNDAVYAFVGLAKGL